MTKFVHKGQQPYPFWRGSESTQADMIFIQALNKTHIKITFHSFWDIQIVSRECLNYNYEVDMTYTALGGVYCQQAGKCDQGQTPARPARVIQTTSALGRWRMNESVSV